MSDDRKAGASGELKIGRFRLEQKLLVGELKVAGSESFITLRDDDFFHVDSKPNLHLTGTLYDQTEVTLVNCVRMSSSHTSGSGASRPTTATLFPHFVIQGRTQLDPDKRSIRAIHFTFDDAPVLFHDVEAFGSLIDATPFISALTQANERQFGRPIRIGSDPLIAYFSGQRLIVEATTALGRIRIEHAPTFPFGGPRGVRIDNSIWISVSPESPVNLEDAVDTVGSLLRFIAIAVGRAQTLPKFGIDIATEDPPQLLDVHWSHYPQRPKIAGERPPHPADTLLDPIEHAEEFKKVLSAWIALDGSRRVARVRTHGSFIEGNFYTTERLVAVANAFDLLPSDAVPKHVDLSSHVLEAKQHGSALFRKLPASDEREALLRALGRIGHATLKQKVRHRTNIIVTAAGDAFPELTWVCDQAIECRNHFVHGSPIRFPVDGPSSAIGFLTDTLEFVFFASEFVECGWDIKRFLSSSTTGSHPFGDYRVYYRQHLQQFRESIGPPTGDGDDDVQ